MFKRMFAVGVFLVSSFSPVWAEPISVVTTIRPIYGLVASVMEGVGKPHLLVDDVSSVHGFQMKPSDMQALDQADVVFWISPGLETFLIKPLATVKASDTEGMLMAAKGMHLLELREDHHDHGHGHGHQDEHGHDEHHDEHAHKDEHDHGHGHDHDEGHDMHMDELLEKDAHVWMSPENAIAMAHHIEAVLTQKDPKNATRYHENLHELEERLVTLKKELDGKLDAHRKQKVLVMHDAYQYLSDGIATPKLIPVSIHFEGNFSAQDIAEAREQVADENVVCILSEPQYPESAMQVIAEVAGGTLPTGVLDPLGSLQEINSGIYSNMMRAMAQSLENCFK